jgi:peptidyl-prolyl cis-trans isomerase C
MPGPVLAQSGGTQGEEDRVVATVGGDELYMSDVVRLHSQLPQQYQQIPMAMLFPQLVDRLVNQKLFAAAAMADGLDQDEEFQDRMAFIRESLLQEAFVASRIEAEMTEERLRADYEKMIAETPPAEEVRARHILLESEEDAKAVIAEIAAGADFAETAKAKSTGPSGPNGGDLSFFKREQMVKPFADAAFAMQPGEVSKEPVQTQFGWHVIKVEERRAGEPPSFEESVEELRNKGAQQIVAALIEKLRDDADVQTFSLEDDGDAEAMPEGDEEKKAE